MQHTPVQKPSLGEIFAALKGVRCAGFALLDGPDGTMHPLVDAGVEAIKISYDLRAELMTRSDIGTRKNKASEQFDLVTKDAEKSARLALEFLAKQKPVLEQYVDINLHQSSRAGNISGGKVSDLIAHIDHMIQFEKIGMARVQSTIAQDGVLSPVYKASYLPEYFVVKPKTVTQVVDSVPVLVNV
jgi:hypothetical protein